MTDNNEIANKIFERLDSLGAQFMTTAPMVWEKMVTLTQFESIAYLIVGGVSLLLTILFTFLLLKSIKYYESHDDQAPIGVILLMIATCSSTLSAGVNLLYIWNWVGAFSPESRLIARLIGAVSGTSS